MVKAANIYYDYENTTTCLGIYGENESENNQDMD